MNEWRKLKTKPVEEKERKTYKKIKRSETGAEKDQEKDENEANE